MTTEEAYTPPACKICERGKLTRRRIHTHSVAARNAGFAGIIVGVLMGGVAALSFLRHMTADLAGIGTTFDLLVAIGSVGLVVLGFFSQGKKPYLVCEYCDATFPAF